MPPRQARRERREAERKAKKLDLKKSRLAENLPLAAVDEFPEIQPRWNPELEDEFPREVQIRNNAMADRISLKVGLPIPPPDSTPNFSSLKNMREHCQARRNAAKANEPGFVSQTSILPLSPPEQRSETAPPRQPKTNENGFVSQNAPTRAEINRANAQHSTGPKTQNGKLASSRNATKHGLASGHVLIAGEDPAAFDSFLHDLLAEHQPATPTERILIEELAQSHWLAQRAIRLQNNCFTEEGVNEKQLALFLRYQTTHQRAFYKALNTLIRMKKDAARAERSFVSQTRPKASTGIGFVSQNDTKTPPSPESVRQNKPQAHETEPMRAKPQAA